MHTTIYMGVPPPPPITTMCNVTVCHAVGHMYIHHDKTTEISVLVSFKETKICSHMDIQLIIILSQKNIMLQQLILKVLY